jgi:hypothetical protein
MSWIREAQPGNRPRISDFKPVDCNNRMTSDLRAFRSSVEGGSHATFVEILRYCWDSSILPNLPPRGDLGRVAPPPPAEVRSDTKARGDPAPPRQLKARRRAAAGMRERPLRAGADRLVANGAWRRLRRGPSGYGRHEKQRQHQARRHVALLRSNVLSAPDSGQPGPTLGYRPLERLLLEPEDTHRRDA